MPETALRHDALVYDGDDDYVDRAVPFLREGLAAGDGAVVAGTRSTLALAREALGADAGDVTFVDVSSAYTRPARTLAAYHDVYVDALSRHRRVRAVADVQFGPHPGEWDLWTTYEAVFNRSFAHLPAWVVCTYAGAALPDRVREGVLRTHAEVATPDGAGGRRFEDPDAVVRALGPDPVPLTGLRAVPPDGGAERIRERLARELAARSVPGPKVLDLLLAVTEVLANAERHGGGVAGIRVGSADGRFVCEVTDRGTGLDDPCAGYLAPRPGVGSGLWIARQLVWQLSFAHQPDGFTARLVL